MIQTISAQEHMSKVAWHFDFRKDLKSKLVKSNFRHEKLLRHLGEYENRTTFMELTNRNFR